MKKLLMKKKVEDIEVVPVPGRIETYPEKEEKEQKKKLNLNKIKVILKNIKLNITLNTIKNTISSIVLNGLIIVPAVIMITDVTIGYSWSWMTIVHILGCGSAYHMIEDFIAMVKSK